MKTSIAWAWMMIVGSPLLLASCGGGSGGGAGGGGSGGTMAQLPLGWVPTFGPGSNLDDGVRALTVFDDGSGGGPALYAGGRFATAGGTEVNHVARWDGSTWADLLTGVLGGTSVASVDALAVFDDGSGSGPALYAGGTFTHAAGTLVNRIAKWDGASWSSLGSGLGDRVNALMVFDDGSTSGGLALYVAGAFTSSLGHNRIAKWNGTSWSSLSNGVNDEVLALAVYDDGTGGGLALFAGGRFTLTAQGMARHVAKWNGSTWSPLGLGTDDRVDALAVFDDGSGGGPALYAGGAFTSAGGKPASRVARWDGSSWSAVGTGLSFPVRALAVFDDGSGGGPALHAGGSVTTTGGAIARWDGATWSPLGAGVLGVVAALGVFDDGTSSGGTPHGPSLFVGGDFTTSPGGDAYLAKWGRSDQAVPSGPQDPTLELFAGDGTGSEPCALTALLGAELRLDDAGVHLVLEGAHAAPERALEWLAGTIELRGGHWRQAEPLVLGVAGPARLVLVDGPRLEIPRVIVGPLGELVGAGTLQGDLENQGRVVPSGPGLELGGRYVESPPGTLDGDPRPEREGSGLNAPSVRR